MDAVQASLLRAAKAEQPSSGGAERALLAAGIVGATSLTAGAAGSAGAKALLGTAKWIAIPIAHSPKKWLWSKPPARACARATQRALSEARANTTVAFRRGASPPKRSSC